METTGSGELGADGNLILQLDPGVVLFLLVAQGDLLVLGIVALDVDLDLVADLDDLGGMVDVVPGQLGDVHQALDAILDGDEDTELDDLGDPCP